MAESFDFQVNDLKFRAATSDKFPYARATAPFRKEQFDASATVGDQSLSGWWTRGQLSFHKGAGIKYYEVLGGDEVLNRYAFGSALDISNPGSTSLGPHVYTHSQTFNPVDVVPVRDSIYGLEYLMISDAGDVYRNASWSATTPTAVSTAAAGDAVALTSSTYAGFVGVNTGTSGNIEKWEHGDTSTSALWSIGTVSLAGVWYLKRRLLAIDTSGRFYHMAADTGGSLTTGDAFATLDGVSDAWRVVETPGPILVANKTTIWAISVDEQASVPTPAAPEVVATLPEGEEVQALGYHIGHVVIGTPRGVRFGVLGTDEIIYGPLVSNIKVSPGRRMAAKNSAVYLLGNDTDNGIVGGFRFDLAVTVEDLVPAWNHAFDTTLSPLDDSWGIVSAGEWGMVAWSEARAAVYEAYPGQPSGQGGSLTTGFHRMGTLDRKHFHEVVVRTAGEGTVQVFRVDADGTETSLGPAFNAGDGETVLSLGLSEPVERIALRFALTRDAGGWTGPELLGYQIKALPSPVRQRLVKWPLMIQDVVRDRYGVSRGTREGAWTAWSELEALEESDALVTFTDHRTGETGEAYIESLELQTDTPTQGANSGFGGVGYITLRKVS